MAPAAEVLPGQLGSVSNQGSFSAVGAGDESSGVPTRASSPAHALQQQALGLPVRRTRSGSVAVGAATALASASFAFGHAVAGQLRAPERATPSSPAPFESVNTFVPSAVTDFVANRRLPSNSLSACIALLDISGFSALCEQYNDKESSIEELCDAINDTFSKEISVVEEFGGEIVSFLGDGLLVYWPAVGAEAGHRPDGTLAEGDESEGEDGAPDLGLLAARAILCGLRVQEVFAQASSGSSSIAGHVRLKIAIACGEFQEYHVGIGGRSGAAALAEAKAARADPAAAAKAAVGAAAAAARLPRNASKAKMQRGLRDVNGNVIPGRMTYFIGGAAIQEAGDELNKCKPGETVACPSVLRHLPRAALVAPTAAPRPAPPQRRPRRGSVASVSSAATAGDDPAHAEEAQAIEGRTGRAGSVVSEATGKNRRASLASVTSMDSAADPHNSSVASLSVRSAASRLGLLAAVLVGPDARPLIASWAESRFGPAALAALRVSAAGFETLAAVVELKDGAATQRRPSNADTAEGAPSARSTNTGGQRPSATLTGTPLGSSGANPFVGSAAAAARGRSRKASIMDALKDEGVLLYIPYTVRARLAEIAALGRSDSFNALQYISEFRAVTVLFVKLDGMRMDQDSVQHTARTLQAVLYSHEGSLRQILLDDKGLVLIGVFGLWPVSHEDDAVRGTACALDMKAALEADGIRCSIGITTGLVYCTFVGSSRRQEYSVFGTVVNRAARLMAKSNGSVLCDEKTHASCAAQLQMEPAGTFLLKGIQGSVAAFRPVGLRNAVGMGAPSAGLPVVSPAKEALSPAPEAAHGRRLSSQHAEQTQPERLIVGREDEVLAIDGSLRRLLYDEEPETYRNQTHRSGVGAAATARTGITHATTPQSASSVLVFEGPSGMGKSALLQYAASAARRLNVAAAAASSASLHARQPLAAWRGIFQQLFPLGLLQMGAFAAGSDVDALSVLAALLHLEGASISAPGNRAAAIQALNAAAGVGSPEKPPRSRLEGLGPAVPLSAPRSGAATPTNGGGPGLPRPMNAAGLGLTAVGMGALTVQASSVPPSPGGLASPAASPRPPRSPAHSGGESLGVLHAAARIASSGALGTRPRPSAATSAAATTAPTPLSASRASPRADLAAPPAAGGFSTMAPFAPRPKPAAFARNIRNSLIWTEIPQAELVKREAAGGTPAESPRAADAGAATTSPPRRRGLERRAISLNSATGSEAEREAGAAAAVAAAAEGPRRGSLDRRPLAQLAPSLSFKRAVPVVRQSGGGWTAATSPADDTASPTPAAPTALQTALQTAAPTVSPSPVPTVGPTAGGKRKSEAAISAAVQRIRGGRHGSTASRFSMVSRRTSVSSRASSGVSGEGDRSAEVRAKSLRALLVKILLARAAQGRPLLILLDDLHNADSQSWAALTDLAAALPDSPASKLVVIVAMRPPDEEGAAAPTVVLRGLRALSPAAVAEQGVASLRRLPERLFTAFKLSPMREGDVEDLAAMTLGAWHIPRALSDFVFAQTSGIPFFVVELVRTLREDGHLAIDASGGCTLKKTLRALRGQLTDAIRVTITARLDRLAPGEIFALKLASVVGPTFTKGSILLLHPSVRAGDQTERAAESLVASLSASLDRDLHALVKAGIVRHCRAPSRPLGGAAAVAAGLPTLQELNEAASGAATRRSDGSSSEAEGTAGATVNPLSSEGSDGSSEAEKIGEDEELEFAHAMMHEVVYGLLPVAERRQLHRAYALIHAEEYARAHAPEGAGEADLGLVSLLAHHFLAADEPAAASPYVEECAAAALGSFANAEALRLYEDLLRIRPEAPPVQRAGWLRSRAEVLRRMGLYEGAVEACGQALALLGAPLPPSQLALSAAALLLRARLAFFRPDRLFRLGFEQPAPPPADPADPFRDPAFVARRAAGEECAAYRVLCEAAFMTDRRQLLVVAAGRLLLAAARRGFLHEDLSVACAVWAALCATQEWGSPERAALFAQMAWSTAMGSDDTDCLEGVLATLPLTYFVLQQFQMAEELFTTWGTLALRSGSTKDLILANAFHVLLLLRGPAESATHLSLLASGVQAALESVLAQHDTSDDATVLIAHAAHGLVLMHMDRAANVADALESFLRDDPAMLPRAPRPLRAVFLAVYALALLRTSGPLARCRHRDVSVAQLAIEAVDAACGEGFLQAAFFAADCLFAAAEVLFVSWLASMPRRRARQHPAACLLDALPGPGAGPETGRAAGPDGAATARVKYHRHWATSTSSVSGAVTTDAIAASLKRAAGLLAAIGRFRVVAPLEPLARALVASAAFPFDDGPPRPPPAPRRPARPLPPPEPRVAPEPDAAEAAPGGGRGVRIALPELRIAAVAGARARAEAYREEEAASEPETPARPAGCPLLCRPARPAGPAGRRRALAATQRLLARAAALAEGDPAGRKLRDAGTARLLAAAHVPEGEAAGRLAALAQAEAAFQAQTDAYRLRFVRAMRAPLLDESDAEGAEAPASRPAAAKRPAAAAKPSISFHASVHAPGGEAGGRPAAGATAAGTEREEREAPRAADFDKIRQWVMAGGPGVGGPATGRSAGLATGRAAETDRSAAAAVDGRPASVWSLAPAREAA